MTICHDCKANLDSIPCLAMPIPEAPYGLLPFFCVECGEKRQQMYRKENPEMAPFLGYRVCKECGLWIKRSFQYCPCECEEKK